MVTTGLFDAFDQQTNDSGNIKMRNNNFLITTDLYAAKIQIFNLPIQLYPNKNV